MNSFLKILFLLIFVIFSSTKLMANDVVGQWTQWSFLQVNSYCQQTWVCSSADDIIFSSESKLVCTKPQKTWGACISGSSSIDGCNACIAAEPTNQCKCKTIPR